MIDLRWGKSTECGRCGCFTARATLFTRFTNLFKRPRIVRINRFGPTPGLHYPGEKVIFLPHKKNCAASRALLRCTCDD